MFDVGFSELLLLALLALILLGPKRLPEVARTAGRWMARLRHFVDNVKQDFDRELRSSELDELRRLKQELDDTRRVIQEASSPVLQGIAAELNAAASTPPIAPPVSESSAAGVRAPLTEPGTPAKPRIHRARTKTRTKKKHGQGKKKAPKRRA